MADPLRIDADWEVLARGAIEERACFAALGIRYGDFWLTQAYDEFVNRVRDKVHLSAYKLAEWLAWNWWRLRWEPLTHAPNWPLAHRMSTIGGGYVWPNIAVFSDGERVALVAKPTAPRPEEPLRYLADKAVVVQANAFESALTLFFQQVEAQLRANAVAETNFDRICADLIEEQSDSGLSMRRRLEALLGFDPDEADPTAIDALIVDSQEIGKEGMEEVAADRGQSGDLITVTDLRELATKEGFESRPNDAIRLSPETSLPIRGQVPAWKLGAEAARAVRLQSGLGASPISNSRLAQMAAVPTSTLRNHSTGRAFSFAFDLSSNQSRIFLRPKWETGRRFELARLLGDRLVSDVSGRLFPATRSYTYRQKLQRSFAAELLCPFDAVEDLLRGHYSPETIEDVADHYQVSERVISTLLVNHGRIARESLESEIETSAAA